jgi:demethylmenaquinone methyltransferase/2-methoxy-6-polyprenyl-1,4-benzoquinol methylase
VNRSNLSSTTRPILDKSPEKIRRMFDSIAPWYDFLNHFFSFGIDQYWRRFTAKQLFNETTPEGAVLDVCCGTGDLTLAFLRRINRQQTQSQTKKTTERRSIFCIDFSPEMIAVGKRKLNGNDSVCFSVGDALSLPFDNDSFAVAATAFGLRNVNDIERSLSEMVRVCKPGGMVAVLEFSMPTLPVLSALYRFYFRSILPRIGQLLARNRDNAYHYLPESVLTFDEPAQLVQRLQSLGVANLQTQPLTFGIVTLTWGVKEQKRLSQ